MTHPKMTIDTATPRGGSEWAEAQILQGAAIIVAAPRYMGAFAAAIGISISSFYGWFPHAEIWSGAFMAIIEGWAVAFIFRRWRSMQTGTAHWWIMLALQLALMLTLPLVAAPYLLSAQLEQPVRAIVSPAMLWLWSLLVAAIAPLILAAVGYADVERASAQESDASINADASIELASETHTCAECGKEFSTMQALSAHKRFCRKEQMTISSNGRKNK